MVCSIYTVFKGAPDPKKTLPHRTYTPEFGQTVAVVMPKMSLAPQRQPKATLDKTHNLTNPQDSLILNARGCNQASSLLRCWVLVDLVRPGVASYTDMYMCMHMYM